MMVRFTWLYITLLFLVTDSFGADKSRKKNPEESLLGDESVLEEEQDFPDLVRDDETGG